MINSIIVEDEERSINVLKKMLADYCPEINVTGVARNLDEAQQLIKAEKPSLVFLDIQLPDGNSFSLIDEPGLRDSRIIFTTAYNDYVLKALKCSALDYLLKPINIDELIEAVRRYHTYIANHVYTRSLNVLQDNLMRENREKIRTIGLSTLNEIQFIATDDIIRLEAASNYTHFYIDGSPKITVSHTIKYYEEMLANGSFMRVHQSHIINLRKVKKYIKGKIGSVVMSDGCTIDVSPKNKEDFLKALNWI